MKNHRKGSSVEKRRRAYSSTESADNQKADLTLYVNNLHHKIKEKHLRESFEKAGPLDTIEIVRDPFTGDSRGFGFVTYFKRDDALKGVHLMNKTEFKGRNISVEIAKRSRPRGPTPGKYLGKFRSHRRRYMGRSRSRSDSYRKSSRHRNSYRNDSRDYRRDGRDMHRRDRDFRAGGRPSKYEGGGAPKRDRDDRRRRPSRRSRSFS